MLLNGKIDAASIQSQELQGAPVIPKKVNVQNAFAAIHEYWSPRIGGEVGDCQLKLAKFKGEFHWHHHEKEDELFFVVKGRLLMKLKPENGGDLILEAGEFVVVPRMTEHCPVALDDEVHCLLFEPNTTLNTGNLINDRTIRDLKQVHGSAWTT